MTTPDITTIENLKEVEDKSVHETVSESGNTHLNWLPSGIVSFAEFDAMEEVKDQANQIKNEASLLKAMIENIMELEPDEDTDKVQMIVDVTSEFATRVQNPTVKEVDHLKEVQEDELKAIDEDFKGGCDHCGFSTQDELKEFNQCPYCYGPINELTDKSKKPA